MGRIALGSGGGGGAAAVAEPMEEAESQGTHFLNADLKAPAKTPYFLKIVVVGISPQNRLRFLTN